MVIIVALLEPRPATARVKNSDRNATKTLRGYPCPAPSQHTKSEMKILKYFRRTTKKPENATTKTWRSTGYFRQCENFTESTIWNWTGCFSRIGLEGWICILGLSWP